MRDMSERPVCHRAEDLVSYLYGETSETDARDFREHLQQCAACRGEFAAFSQVHESILVWRNEALGSSFNAAAIVNEPSIDATGFIHHERRLSAMDALREFFSVSPLWLRGTTAFAGLLLCALVIFIVARNLQRPNSVANRSGDEKVYTRADFDAAVAKEVKIQTDRIQQAFATRPQDAVPTSSPRPSMARVRIPAKPKVKGLTLEEREQLAADLRLIPGVDDDEFPFGSSDQPDQ